MLYICNYFLYSILMTMAAQTDDGLVYKLLLLPFVVL